MYPCVFFVGNMSCLLLGEKKMTYSPQRNIFYEMYYGWVQFLVYIIALTEKLQDILNPLAYLCSMNKVNSVLSIFCWMYCVNI